MENLEVTSANKLFERPAPKNYLEEWTKLLTQPLEKPVNTEEVSLVVFRLAKEWFGLSALIFSEIGERRTINLIPYPSDPILLGVVNMQGQLRLCFSMHDLLGLEKSENEQKSEKLLIGSHYPRLLAISQGNELYTFPSDEVESVYQFDLSKMTNVPITILNSRENYIKGVIKWNEKNIYIINEDMLFLSLRGRLS